MLNITSCISKVGLETFMFIIIHVNVEQRLITNKCMKTHKLGKKIQLLQPGDSRPSGGGGD